MQISTWLLAPQVVEVRVPAFHHTPYINLDASTKRALLCIAVDDDYYTNLRDREPDVKLRFLLFTVGQRVAGWDWCNDQEVGSFHDGLGQLWHVVQSQRGRVENVPGYNPESGQAV